MNYGLTGLCRTHLLRSLLSFSVLVNKWHLATSSTGDPPGATGGNTRHHCKCIGGAAFNKKRQLEELINQSIIILLVFVEYLLQVRTLQQGGHKGALGLQRPQHRIATAWSRVVRVPSWRLGRRSCSVSRPASGSGG